MKWYWWVLAVIAGIAALVRLYMIIFIPEARVTSWWRDPIKQWKNWSVNPWNGTTGWAFWSQHLIGWAIDAVPKKESDASTVKAKMGKLFPYVIWESDHYHGQLIKKG